MSAMLISVGFSKTISHSVDDDLVSLLIEKICHWILLRNSEKILQVVSKHTHTILGSHIDTPSPRTVLLGCEGLDLDSKLIQLLESRFEIILYFAGRKIVHMMTNIPDVTQIYPVVAHVHIGLNLHVSVLKSCNSNIETHGGRVEVDAESDES